jgi:hypothetical protein
MNERNRETMRDVMVFVALLSVVLMLLVAHAFAHDHEHPELNSWFLGLKSKAKVACCDGSEALRLEDVDWESHDGHYRVRIDVSREVGKVDMQWIDVPDDAVVDQPNLYGRAMVWPVFISVLKPSVRCFMPGAEG